MVLFACGWSCTPPGKGEKAEAGYASAKPVIAALEAYRAKNNEYPAKLGDLIPEGAARTSDGQPVAEFFEYSKMGASYRMLFKYTGPGMNRCVYTPEAAKWECSGYQ